MSSNRYRYHAEEVATGARMDAALALVAHRAGKPTIIGETLLLLAACAPFADDPKAPGIVERLTKALTEIGAPLPHPDAMLAAVYGAGQAGAVLTSAGNTVERIEVGAEPETQTTAEILRGWAADAEEAMREPLLALAQHAEQELATAGQSVAADAAREAERNCLEAIADKLSEIKTRGHMNAPVVVEPEIFAILASLEQLSTGVSYLVNGLEESADKLEAAGALACEYQRRADAAEKALHDARRHLEHLRLALHGGLVETQAQAAS